MPLRAKPGGIYRTSSVFVNNCSFCRQMQLNQSLSLSLSLNLSLNLSLSLSLNHT